MEITVDRRELLADLELFGNVVDTTRDSMLPDYSNVTFRPLEAGSLALVAQGGEMGQQTRLEAARIEGDGPLSVPARLLRDWLKLAGEDQVRLFQDEKNWVRAECGNGHTRIPGRVSEPPTLPKRPDAPQFTLGAETFGQLLRAGSYAFPVRADPSVARGRP